MYNHKENSICTFSPETENHLFFGFDKKDKDDIENKEEIMNHILIIRDLFFKAISKDCDSYYLKINSQSKFLMESHKNHKECHLRHINQTIFIIPP